MADWFVRAFGASVADVRQKLVDEAWFGRRVGARPAGEFMRDPTNRSPSEQLGWDHPDHQQSHHQPPDMDRGIDR